MTMTIEVMTIASFEATSLTSPDAMHAMLSQEIRALTGHILEAYHSERLLTACTALQTALTRRCCAIEAATEAAPPGRAGPSE